MPIYESLASDKLTVVLEIGQAYTKFGFAGEFKPRTILRSEVTCRKTNRPKRIWDYSTPEELYDSLVDFIHFIYFRYALLSPKDRPIVVVESLLCPTVFREALAKVLFVHYEVSMLLMLPSHLVSVASIPVDTAVVIDMGYKEAVAIPICHGFPVIQAWQALPIGAEVVHDHLRQLLSSQNSGVQNLPETTIEDIKVRCCFVTKKARAEKLSAAKPEISPCPDVTYPMGTESILVSGKVREKAYEIFYEEDNDHFCLSTMILDAIQMVDMNLRQRLAENIVVIGGTASVPGFKARLKEELEKQMKCKRYKKLNIKKFAFHSLPCKENYAAWLGGAIYGATDLVNTKSLTRENYFKENHLPDWSNLKYNSTNSG